MIAPHPLLLSLLLPLLAGAACASTPPAPAPVPAEEPVMICQADAGQWALGQSADEAVVARVVADTGSERARVVRPGMAVTTDFRVERVNIEVDADNRIVSVRCG
jgi:hypothetical protein